jgi:hypothetical protein
MTTEETRPPESPTPWPASDQPGTPGPAPQTSEDLQSQQNAKQAAQREQEAQSGAEMPTDDDVTGAGGMRLGRHVSEIAGGGKIHEHTADPEPDPVQDAYYKQRRYAASRLAKEAGPLLGRAASDIGLYGKGETYRGGGILVDFKFTCDEVYANSRDMPHALSTGDLAANLSGETAQKMTEQRK